MVLNMGTFKNFISLTFKIFTNVLTPSPVNLTLREGNFLLSEKSFRLTCQLAMVNTLLSL